MQNVLIVNTLRLPSPNTLPSKPQPPTLTPLINSKHKFNPDTNTNLKTNTNQ